MWLNIFFFIQPSYFCELCLGSKNMRKNIAWFTSQFVIQLKLRIGNVTNYIHWICFSSLNWLSPIIFFDIPVSNIISIYLAMSQMKDRLAYILLWIKLINKKKSIIKKINRRWFIAFFSIFLYFISFICHHFYFWFLINFTPAIQ